MLVQRADGDAQRLGDHLQAPLLPVLPAAPEVQVGVDLDAERVAGLDDACRNARAVSGVGTCRGTPRARSAPGARRPLCWLADVRPPQVELLQDVLDAAPGEAVEDDRLLAALGDLQDRGRVWVRRAAGGPRGPLSARLVAGDSEEAVDHPLDGAAGVHRADLRRAWVPPRPRRRASARRPSPGP